MVAELRPAIQTVEEQEPQSSDLKWAGVGVSEVVDHDYRLEASYGIAARQTRQDLEQCKWDIVHLDTFIEEAFHGGRSKRVYIDKNNKNAVGFLGSAEMLSIQPKPVKFLLKEDGASKFSVKQGQVLLSRSGTVGNVNYVNSTLANFFVSEHAIRISCREYPGYVYTFLKSKKGRVLVESYIFGAVISQVEPEHLNQIPIPNPPPILKQKVHSLIEESFKLRDESNELMDETQVLLKEALQLPDLEDLCQQAEQYDKTAGVLNYLITSNELCDRLDGSYHVPTVQVIEQHLEKTAKEIVKAGDSRISQAIIMPSHFEEYMLMKVKVLSSSAENISIH